MVQSITDSNKSWWRQWLVVPIINQLKAGTSPTCISWTIALGMVLGVFPILGSTTLVCILVAWFFRLNQAVMHVFKWLVYPLHLALILVFIRMGERLLGAPPIPFSIQQLIVKFKDDPLQFASDFGMTALHGVIAWLLIAPFAVILIKVSVMPIVDKLARSLRARKERIA
jgi:uncharacterized protein (DUF2062 family)